MTMDDGQVMGIIVYAHEDGYHEINAFVSCQPGSFTMEEDDIWAVWHM